MRGRIDFISGSLQYYRIIVKLIMLCVVGIKAKKSRHEGAGQGLGFFG